MIHVHLQNHSSRTSEPLLGVIRDQGEQGAKEIIGEQKEELKGCRQQRKKKSRNENC